MMSESDLLERARRVRREYRDQLMALPHVVGLGVGYRVVKGVKTDTVAVVVMVDKKIPASQLLADNEIPNELDGVPVDVQEVGTLRANST